MSIFPSKYVYFNWNKIRQNTLKKLQWFNQHYAYIHLKTKQLNTSLNFLSQYNEMREKILKCPKRNVRKIKNENGHILQQFILRIFYIDDIFNISIKNWGKNTDTSSHFSRDIPFKNY